MSQRNQTTQKLFRDINCNSYIKAITNLVDNPNDLKRFLGSNMKLEDGINLYIRRVEYYALDQNWDKQET